VCKIRRALLSKYLSINKIIFIYYASYIHDAKVELKRRINKSRRRSRIFLTNFISLQNISKYDNARLN